MPTSIPSDVRQWGRDNGLVTADRGRLPRAVLDAYAAAHQEPGADAMSRRKPARRPSGKRAPAATRSAEAKAAGHNKSAARSSKTNGPGDAARLAQRLQAVETQLADALARIEALESRTTRSLLGLRTTL